MIFNITINSTDLDDLKRFEKLVESIKHHGWDLEKSDTKIESLQEAITALEDMREDQLEKLQEAKDMKAKLEAIRTEVADLVKSDYEEIQETITDTLTSIGLNRKFIEDKIDDIEKAVRYNKRNGYFKSSEQSAVYEKLSAIGEYLDKFPDVTNPELKDFSDIHVKKLFSLDFDKIRSTLDDFKLSESALQELQELTDNVEQDVKLEEAAFICEHNPTQIPYERLDFSALNERRAITLLQEASYIESSPLTLKQKEYPLYELFSSLLCLLIYKEYFPSEKVSSFDFTIAIKNEEEIKATLSFSKNTYSKELCESYNTVAFCAELKAEFAASINATADRKILEANVDREYELKN
ncbi:hypothetical protein L1887_49557 [Cichorium endivia]|nr:hypothetical protein L1887_49557 [Cichorium endivia]